MLGVCDISRIDAELDQNWLTDHPFSKIHYPNSEVHAGVERPQLELKMYRPVLAYQDL